MTRKIYFPFILAGALAFAGCKSSSTSSPANGGNTSSTIVTPAEGSYFLMSYEDRDSTGKLIDSGTDTETVYLTGLPLFGNTNVMELLTTHSGLSYSGVEWMNYEPNGDVTLDSSANLEGAASIVEGTEVTYPFSTQGTNNSFFDTTIQGNLVLISIGYSGAGAGSITIGSQTFTTEKINASVGFVGTGVNFSETVQLSFAPALGVIVEKTVLQGAAQTYHEIVTSYVLK